MSPAKFNGDLHHEDSRKGEINDPRSSPLKINNGSHLIHKSTSSTMSSMSIGSSVSGVASAARQQEQQPVIIYTHSPKIIHTQARDFMALVQKLTGVSSSQSGDNINANRTTSALLDMEGNECNLMPVRGHGDNESTNSVHANENFGGAWSNSSSINDMSPIQNPTNQYSANMPLFTTNTTSFVCSPRPVFREPDSAYVLPNMGNSMSPSVIEFMKGLSEY
ncbi:VQ motif-containing protein 8, chloroplastic-like [Juglans microcarpa x Juglans regia]|uniref:VQ motif-containing protein 8, chloroplastic-like n=1 Tax=Juglans microcarpa x Juglans regia TaxID=2249226 RepID=UPI001B7E5D8A|nr:VQ motif-containing protein 8, chloroplastic-like [Juglans microcarpa x Juglans regia]